MTKAQVRLAVGLLALVAVAGGAFALFGTQRHGRGELDDQSDLASVRAPAAAPETAEGPVKLSSVGVSLVRDYFASSGYRFEDRSSGQGAQVIGTSENGHTGLEFVGPAGLQRATLRYKLRDGSLNGGDLHAVMYLMQLVRPDEADVRWGIDAARKGEPTTRTIGTVTYAIQPGPSGTKEFVMRPAPGFE